MDAIVSGPPTLGLAARPRPAARRGPGHGLRRVWQATPFYRLRLAGRAPSGIAPVPPDPWPGDAERGARIVKLSAAFAGDPVPPGNRTLVLDHDFAWLRDLRAVGGDNARIRARQLVLAWIGMHGRRPGPGWAADICGERLVNWLCHAGFALADAEAEAEAENWAVFLGSLGRQVRHLMHMAGRGPADARRLVALKGCVYAAACLPGLERRLGQVLAELEFEIARQVLADGVHFERNPLQQLAVLRDFVDIRATLAAAEYEAPTALHDAIDRMAPALRALRHGDGGLAAFNGGNEAAGWLVDLVLDQADARGKAPMALPHAGFQRIVAGRVAIVVDAGAPPPAGADGLAHAGTLAFEMSVGRERLIVNCGSWQGDDPDWRHACRASAAHSTLVVDDTNSSQILRDGGLRRRPGEVVCERGDIDGAVLLDMRHDGYARRFGLVHRRRLHLDANGVDLRGEDSLIGSGGGSFAVRFHLHPEVRIGRARERNSLTLKLPSGAAWRMLATGGGIGVEESVYLAAGGARRSNQVVIAGDLDGKGALVKWAIRRES